MCSGGGGPCREREDHGGKGLGGGEKKIKKEFPHKGWEARWGRERGREGRWLTKGKSLGGKNRNERVPIVLHEREEICSVGETFFTEGEKGGEVGVIRWEKEREGPLRFKKAAQLEGGEGYQGGRRSPRGGGEGNASLRGLYFFREGASLGGERGASCLRGGRKKGEGRKGKRCILRRRMP